MEAVFEPEIGNIVGPQKEGSWSGIFWQEPQDRQLQEARGRLFLVLVISLPVGFSPPAPLAHSFWAHLSNSFYGKKEGGVLSALESAVSSSLVWLDQSVAPFKKELALQKINFGLAAGSLWGKVLYLAQTGEASVKIIRGGKLKTILSSFEVSGGDIFSDLRLSCASGFLQKGDFVIFSTRSFEKAAEDQEILSLLERDLGAREFCEAISPAIHESEDSCLIAALILKMNLVSAPTKEEAVTFSQVTESKLQPIKSQPERKFGGFWRKIFSKFKLIVQIGSILQIIGKKALPIWDRFWPRSELYLRDSQAAKAVRKRIIAVLLIVLVFIFLGSIFLGVRERGKTAERLKFDEIYQKANQETDEAQSILDLNRVRSRELLEDAQNLLSQASQLNVPKGKIKSLSEKIGKLKGQALKIIDASGLGVFFDLSLAKKEAKGEKIVLLGTNLLILDPLNSSVYLLGRETKSTKVYTGDFAKGKYLAVSGEKPFILKEDEGLFELDLASGQPKKVLEKDSNWGQIKDIFSYNDNLYLLSSQKNQIWKYPGAPSGFGAIVPFVKEGTANFSKSISLAVDGTIWVLTQDGGVMKILPGSVESVDIGGLDKPLSYPLAIETASEYKNIYILDKGNKRIVVLNKDGEYDSQYQADFITGAQDFVVDEKAGDIFVLLAPKIYQVKIQ